MKLLAISGSPRKRGNTDLLLARVVEGARQEGADGELLRVADFQITPCRECNKCRPEGSCDINDDMQIIYDKMLEADGIVFGTPVFFWGMTGQLKVLLDRTYALISPEVRLRNKVGGVVVVAGRTAATLTSSWFYLYFTQNHMLAADYVHGFADDRGSIVKDRHAMMAAWELGRQVVALHEVGFRYPEQYAVPIYRHVSKEHGIPIGVIDQS